MSVRVIGCGYDCVLLKNEVGKEIVFLKIHDCNIIIRQ